MFITLSKEKFEDLKKKLTKDNVPYRVEITKEGLFHVTFPELDKQTINNVFSGYLNTVRKEDGKDKYPDWIKYLYPKKPSQGQSQKQKEATEYA